MRLIVICCKSGAIDYRTGIALYLFITLAFCWLLLLLISAADSCLLTDGMFVDIGCYLWGGLAMREAISASKSL